MKTKFNALINSFFSKINNLRNKRHFWSILVFLLTIIIIIIAYKSEIKLPSSEQMDVVGKSIVLILQFIGFLLIVLFVITITRWALREKKGAVIYPFNIPEIDKSLNGQLIVDDFIAYRYKLMNIYTYQKEETPVQNVESGSNNQKEELPVQNTESKIIYSKSTDPKLVNTKQTKVEPQNLRTFIPNQGDVNIKTASLPDLNPMPNVTVKVGDSPISIGQILTDIKRLWNEPPPKFIITGSLHKYNNGFKLIVKRESEISELWEATRDSLDSSALSEIVKEIALNSVIADVGKWHNSDSINYYMEANDLYNQYKRTNNSEILQNASEKMMEAISRDKDIKTLPPLLEELCSACYFENKYESAAQICEHIFELENNLKPDLLSEIYVFYGNCLENLSKYNEASDAYQIAKLKNKNNFHSYYYLTLLYNRLHEFGGLKILGLESVLPEVKIKENIEEVKKRKLVDSFSLGEWYKELGIYSEAIVSYQTAISKDPRNIVLLHRIGIIFQELRDNDKAIKTLTKAINLAKYKKDINLAYILHNLAYVYNFSNKEDSIRLAQEFYKRAILEDPLYALSYSNLGIIYESEGRLEDALELYFSAFLINSNELDFCVQIATIYNRLDKNKEAIDFLLTNNIFTDSSLYHSILAMIYCDNSELNKAIKNIKLAINLEPENSYAFRDLGYFYVGKNYIDKAVHAFNESLKFNSELRYTHAAKAACFRRLGMLKEYETEVNFALHLKIEDGETEYNQASFEALCGRTNEALNYLEVALQKRQRTAAYAAQDWDFYFIKDDPRFTKMITAV